MPKTKTEARKQIRRIARGMLMRMMRFAYAHDTIHRLGHWMLGATPRLKQHLEAFARFNAARIKSTGERGYLDFAPSFAEAALSPETCQIYLRMRKALPPSSEPSSQ